MATAERKVREIDRFLSELSIAWIPLRDAAALVRVTADALAKQLQVNRVTFAGIAPDASSTAVEFTHNYRGVTVAGTHLLKEFLIETALAELVEGKSIIVADVTRDPRTEFAREKYREINVCAFVTVPLQSDKGLQALLGINTSSPRNWRADDVQLLEHVAARLWPAIERARAEEEVRRNHLRHEFLLRLIDAVRPLNDPVEIQETTSRLVGEHLRVNRVLYVDIDGGEFIIRMSYAKDVAPFTRRGQISDFGSVFLEAFARGEGLIVNDVRSDPRFTENERATQLASDIVASAEAILMKGGRCVGAFAVHSATARTWTRDEIDLIRDVAERAWDSIQRAQTEAALREREQRLRLALHASGGGSWTWDAIDNRLDWDDRFREIYGFTASEPPVSEGWVSRLHPDDRERLLSFLNETLQSPTRDTWDNTYRIVLPDGAVRWIQSRGCTERTASGQITRLTGLDLDVTERRKAEDALLAQRDEERDRTLRLLLETAAQGILSMDAQGIIVTANRALEEMFGWPRGSLIGEPVERLLPPDLRDQHTSHRTAYIAALKTQVLSSNTTLTGMRQDGSVFPIEISMNHVTTQSGGHAIAFVTDVSARRQADAALHRSHAALEERTSELELRTNQLSRLTSELTLAEQNTREQLARTLHDGLQQLLFSASLRLGRLAKRSSHGAGEAELFAQIKTDVDNAIAASRSLSVDLSPPALHIAGLPAAVSWLADWMKEKYGLEVQATIDPLANSDRKDVRTLVFESLRELLFNAVKHAQVPRVAVVLARGSDSTLRVTVTDQGVGFDPATLLNRTNSQTTGLGLFSIRERLTLLGGQFDFTSSPGQGTQFRLIAPLSSNGHVSADESTDLAERKDTPDRAISASAPRKLRILVVDDHAAVREGLRELLQERSEFEVVGEASNGLEAMAQAKALRPDVILIDISMPVMDGIEATRRIHAAFPFIQIFGLSAHELATNLHAIRQAGGSDYFIKNADMGRLIDRLLSIQ